MAKSDRKDESKDDPKDDPKAGAENSGEAKAMTAAEAARLVVRQVPVLKDGQPTGETMSVPIAAGEVLAFRQYADRVVVVTIDGQKFEGRTFEGRP